MRNGPAIRLPSIVYTLLSTFMPLEGLTAETFGGRILAFADTAHAVRDALAAPALEPADGVAPGEAALSLQA